MAKEKAMSVATVLQDIFLHFGVYKRNQGRVARQVTCAAIWVVFLLASMTVYNSLLGNSRYYISAVVFLAGLWLGYRIVNIPQFAEFLTAVESEMNKVSWPTRGELIRSSLVVVVVIFAFAMLLFFFDGLWRFLFQFIGILRGGT